MTLKKCKSNLEDSKFSYVAIRKRPRPLPRIVEGAEYKDLQDQVNNMDQYAFEWNRLVAPPMKRGGHVVMDACSPRGKLERFAITHSFPGTLYKSARKSYWHDMWPDVIRKNPDQFWARRRAEAIGASWEEDEDPEGKP